MGFTIFESSGIFNPSDYGLKINDIITVVCVGGGGSGKNAGGSSSFGSYLTAAGGVAGGSLYYGGDGGWHPSCPLNKCNALPDGCDYQFPIMTNAGVCSNTTVPILYGGGQGGYQASASATSDFSVSKSSLNGNWEGVGGQGSSLACRTGASSNYPTTYYHNLGGGGAGYGGGAGGVRLYQKNGITNTASSYYVNADWNFKGGGRGKYIINSIKLSSNDNIAITVGNGGSSWSDTKTHSTQTSYYVSISGGAGAPGCVAVYW